MKKRLALAQDLVYDSLSSCTHKERVKEEGKSEAEFLQHKSDSFQYKNEKQFSEQL